VLALMRADRAGDLFRRQSEIQDYQRGMLRTLVEIDTHILVTTESFPRHHGWLVTSALVENGAQLNIRVVTGSAGGGAALSREKALAFARGEPLEVVQ
jgi:hypothetical protein